MSQPALFGEGPEPRIVYNVAQDPDSNDYMRGYLWKTDPDLVQDRMLQKKSSLIAFLHDMRTTYDGLEAMSDIVKNNEDKLQAWSAGFFSLFKPAGNDGSTAHQKLQMASYLHRKNVLTDVEFVKIGSIMMYFQMRGEMTQQEFLTHETSVADFDLNLPDDTRDYLQKFARKWAPVLQTHARNLPNLSQGMAQTTEWAWRWGGREVEFDNPVFP